MININYNNVHRLIFGEIIMIRIEHIAIWTRDLEKMKDFYCKYFNGVSNELYQNTTKGFSSYFISFGTGTRVELMHSIHLDDNITAGHNNRLGIVHIAISLGSKDNVDSLTKTLEIDGYTIVGQPRTTGDGYYESCILDPENNLIELTS